MLYLMVFLSSRVLVHGRLDYVSYDDEDGTRRSYSSIVMGKILYLVFLLTVNDCYQYCIIRYFPCISNINIGTQVFLLWMIPIYATINL